MTFSFKLNLASGEAEISRTSLKQMAEMIADDPLLAADLLRDMKDDVGQLYDKARAAAFPGQ